MKAQIHKDVDRILREEREVVADALKRGTAKAMLRHKKDDQLVVVERDGKIEWVKPADLGY